MTHLCSDRLGQRVGHGAMVERADQASFAVHRQVARSPNGWRADIARENRVFGGQFVEYPDDVLRMNRLVTRLVRCKIIEALSGLLVMFQRDLQMVLVLVLF